MTIPTDGLYPRQTHLDQIGNIEAVWDDYTGRGVRVAVYDFGIDLTHPDLAANYDASGHFAGQDGRPDDPDEAHGTAVAGIIAAAANGTGTVGVAHGASVTSVELDPLFETWDTFRAGFRHAANFDVMNNSWGLTAPFWDPDLNLNVPGSTAQVLDSLFAEVAATGRGGLGTVIVQAAGNDGYNANADGMLASRYSILTGAGASGFLDNFSNSGAAVLIRAPVAQVTTDNVGEAGYNGVGTGDGDSYPVDYTSEFSGTSSSAPIVSAAVALMLEANPNLGWRDVKNILAMSASAGSLSPYGFGSTFVPYQENWNGGGLVSDDGGFGALDVQAAVAMAEAWAVIHPEALTSANEIRHQVQFDAVNVPIPDAVVRNDGFGDYNLPGSISIVTRGTPIAMEVETVEVTITLQHSWASDLTIELMAGRKVVTLFNRLGGDSLLDDGLTWTFKVESFRGMPNSGDWTLRIHDSVPDDTGVIESASITVYGAAVSENDVYTYTDDVFNVRRAGGGIGFLSDTNGGVDWLNFAAVTGDVEIKAESNRAAIGIQSFLGSGGNWATAVENFYMGSGDDRVEGNAAANVIYGMRGSDHLDGRGGADTLYGGDGHDLLYGSDPGDVSYGGDGNDRYVSWHGGGAGYGDAGSDQLTGGWGIDSLYGGQDADTLAGRAEADLLAGGDGDDSATGGDGNDNVSGDAGNDTLLGDAGSDTLSGGLGDDSMEGGADNDVLDAGFGNDTARGGLGADLVSAGAGNDITFGGDGNDVMNADDGNDTTFGDEGNDRIFGGDGVDRLYGGNGNDSADGGTGIDFLYGEAGLDTLLGGLGNDALFGGEDNDRMQAGDGNDTADGGLGDDVMDGGTGNDRLLGREGNDTVYGQDGNDTVAGGDGNDVVLAGVGDDSLLGEAGADVLRGGDGNDTVDGGTGNDTVDGGLGDDSLFGGADNDRLLGLDGNDTVDGGLGDDAVDGGLGDDRVLGRDGNDTVYGQDGNDSVSGGEGNDLILTGAGDDLGLGEGGADVLFGGDGRDRLDGGAGDDTVDGGAGDDVLAGGDGDDSVTGAEGVDNLTGLAGNDTLDGGAGRDVLAGGTGADSLTGGNGADRIDGGADNDTLTGGGGRDVFVFLKGSGVDLIADFADNVDALRLDAALWDSTLTLRDALLAHGSIDDLGRVVLSFGADVLVVAGVSAVASLFDDAGLA